MAPKLLRPEGRASRFRAKAAWSVAWTDAARHFGGVGRDSTGDKVMLSNWRDPPRPVEKLAEQGSRITGDTGKSVDGERDSAESVVARKRSNVRGAKRPCCL